MLHEIWKIIHGSSFKLRLIQPVAGHRIMATSWAWRNPEGVEIE
jgi:hypothetical protein